ncbi:MAG: hypothetical protein IJW82_06050, partial [Clostridia bacterium]|nr:hypothetical protein [Clostridia bacterium]
EEKMTSSIFSLTSEQVEFFGYFSNEIEFANFNQMSFDITLTDMEKDINSLIVEVDNTKYYANPSDENRKIILTEEKLFSDLNFEENSTQHITLDLFKMGIKKGRNFRFYADFNQTGVMSLSNITLSNILTAETSLFLNNYLVKDVLVQNFTPTTNSNFLGEITFDNSQILTSNIFGFDLYGQNIDISKLVLKSGSTILNLNTNSTSVINDNETVLLYIDLKNYNVQEIKNNGIQVYYDFLDSSKINISNVMLANLENKYQYIVNQFEVFEEIDNVSPKVEIYNSPSFELTSVSSLFIVDFDADANDNGDVETVQIILTGPNGDVQYGDSQNKSFRVSEGTYQLKILATDYNKNVGEATATILVTDNVPNVNPDNPNQSGNTGIGNTDTKDEVEAKSKVWLIVLIVVISLLVASGITVGIIFFIKRKNNFGNFKLK